MAKLICEVCGEIPIPINIAENIENDETEFTKFGKHLTKGVKCAKCKKPIKLVRGTFTSEEAIEKSKNFEKRLKDYVNRIDSDSLVYQTNNLVINHTIKMVEPFFKVNYHKNILLFILVGENTPDGCITYSTKTLYSGLYTIFPEVKNIILKNSLLKLKESKLLDHHGKLLSKEMNDILKIKGKNYELQKKNR